MSLEEGENEKADKLANAKKFCYALQGEDRKVRKQAFVDFENFISNRGDFNNEEYHNMFNETHIYILNGIRDKSEPVREQAIKFISIFLIDLLPKNDYYLSYVFPILTERLGSCELVEESEEVRLQLMKLVESIITKYFLTDQLKPFLNDIIMILKETVQDKYPAIKETSCHCIIKLAHALPRDFHMQAESLVKPVLSNFGHQRYKIRCEAINCIGEIILNSSHKGLEEVVGPMAERLFDQIPAVRRAVAQVASRWLLEYRDRYSFFYKLLPLILTGLVVRCSDLNDEVPETRQEAHQLWEIIGLQYQKENENDLKDQLDYLTEPPKHYLKDLKRPNLGCRVLVQRNVGKLAKPMSRELASWQTDVRIRCSQLLCAVVLHAEDGITHHLQDLLPAMYMAARDEDKTVVDNIIQASEIIGLFVSVETWKKIILPAIEDGSHFGHLCVLAALIRGAPRENVTPSLDEISQLLADKSICQSRKKRYQQELVNCVNAIMRKYEIDSSSVGKYLFTVLVTVISLRDVENNHVNVSLLDELYKTLELDSKYELWNKYLDGLLNEIKVDPKSWTVVTPERCIFETVLLDSDEAFGENLTLIGKILVDALDTNADAESRLKTFIALSYALDKKHIIFKNTKNLNVFLETLVIEVFVPSLVWHAGRTAEAMRTMTASCLFSALNPNEGVEIFTSADVLQPLFNKMVPLLLSLMEDASSTSRKLAIQDLVLLKETAGRVNVWNLDALLKIYPEIVKRLDDPTGKVRVCAIQSLALIIDNPPEEFLKANFKSHHEFLIDTLLIHFDDDDDELQELIMDVLKVLAKLCTEVLLEKLTKHKPLLRNQKGCNAIVAYAENLNTEMNP